MNQQMFLEMMRNLGQQSTASMPSMQTMLPAPPPLPEKTRGAYAPGGSMFPDASKQEQDPDNPIPAPTSMLGKAAQAVAPMTRAAVLGKGGA